MAKGEHELVVRAQGYSIQRIPIDTPKLNAGAVEIQLSKTRVSVGDKDIKILEKVMFESGSGVIKEESFALLDEIANTLIATPKIKKVQVQGHTDNRGRDEANLELSQARADAVVAYLIGKGVDESRLLAKGFGETKPIEDNRSAAGRKANRRVEFKILGQGKRGQKKAAAEAAAKPEAEAPKPDAEGAKPDAAGE